LMMGYHSIAFSSSVFMFFYVTNSLHLQVTVLENDLRRWEIDREIFSDEDLDRTQYENNIKFNEEGSVNESTDNLCMDGHLVPQFFLLGAQKTSTTTLANNLYASGSIYFPAKQIYWDSEYHGRGTIKELMFFSQNVGLEDKVSWLNYYPKCSSFKRRVVATDCTPTLYHSGSAKRIADFYGTLKSKLVFGVMLREPLARTQSAFYHHKAHKGRIPEEMTFNEFIKGHLRDKSDIRDIMWGSQYPKQLEKYFKEFEPGQFWIVPFRYNVSPDQFGIATSFTNTLWNELGVPPGDFEEGRHSNVHEHPQIDEDLDMNTLRDAMNLFSSIAPAVTNLLASSNFKLFGYTGKAGDKVAIKKWLTEGW